MTSSHIFSTEITLSLGYGGNTELGVALHYEYLSGQAACHDDPGCADSVEVSDVLLTRPGTTEALELPHWLRATIAEDAGLRESLLEHARDEASRAAALALEHRAEVQAEARCDDVNQGFGADRAGYGGYENY